MPNKRMSGREELAAIIHEHLWGAGYPADEADCCADAVLASDWLAAHDRRVRSTEQQRMAEEIANYADYEAARLSWPGTPGELGNWIGGIREGVKVIRGERP